MRYVPSRGPRTLGLFLCGLLLTGGSCGEHGDAGVLTGVLSSTTWLDGEHASGGDRIPFGAVLETDRSGIANIVLGTGRLSCRILQDSEIRLGQGARPRLELVAGRLACRSGATGEDREQLEAAGTVVEVGRADVDVRINEQGAVVGNVGGDVTVGDLPLADREQVEVDGTTGALGPTGPIAPDALSAEAFDEIGDDGTSQQPEDGDAPTDGDQDAGDPPTGDTDDGSEPEAEDTEPPET
jgi:hypothetical protein